MHKLGRHLPEFTVTWLPWCDACATEQFALFNHSSLVTPRQRHALVTLSLWSCTGAEGAARQHQRHAALAMDGLQPTSAVQLVSLQPSHFRHRGSLVMVVVPEMPFHMSCHHHCCMEAVFVSAPAGRRCTCSPTLLYICVFCPMSASLRVPATAHAEIVVALPQHGPVL